MLTAYLPGSILSRGKLNWPCALLTTHVLMVEPVFFAPTRTPSIGPSACELTVPVSAAEEDVPSASVTLTNAVPNRAVPTKSSASHFALLMTISLAGKHRPDRHVRATVFGVSF